MQKPIRQMSNSEEVLEIDDFLEELLEEVPQDDQVDFDMGELEPISGEEEIQNKKLLYIPKSKLTAGQVVNILRRMLREINPVYIDLAEHTAFCAIKVYDYARLRNKMDLNIDRNALILLSVLFTIGAYKYEINIEGTTENVQTKTRKMFLYSYLYLRHMSPLREIAEAILFYNYKWEDAKKLGSNYVEYASLIFTCMRICIQLRKNQYVYNSRLFNQEFIDKCQELYNPVYINLFFEPALFKTIIKEFKNNNCFYLLDEYCNTLQLDYDESFSLLKMMLYSVDFISTSTVTHIISTSFHATEIAKLEKLSEDEIDEEFTAAILHDMGKLSVDIDILESSGRLSDEQMAKMRDHVKKGDEMYRGIIGNKIADIASRHHESLDGLGYPMGLKENEITTQQRILSIADVFSALTDARTYKPAYPKEKAISIMEDMAAKHKIDSDILKRVISKYDEIKENTEIRRPMLTTNLGSVLIDFFKIEDCQTIPEIYRLMHED